MVQQHFILNDFSHVHIYTKLKMAFIAFTLQIILRHWEHCHPHVAASGHNIEKGDSHTEKKKKTITKIA